MFRVAPPRIVSATVRVGNECDRHASLSIASLVIASLECGETSTPPLTESR
jgi:hypothetical protein